MANREEAENRHVQVGPEFILATGKTHDDVVAELDEIIIKSLKDIKTQNESVLTGSGVYFSEKGVGEPAPETIYDTSMLQEELKVQEELKDGDITAVD